MDPVYRTELGVADIWPSYWPRVQVLMLRAFYDGSGKGEDLKSESLFLTLAGIVAYDDLWSDLEGQWRALLQKHQMPYIHMRHLGGLQKCFEGKHREVAEFVVSQFVALISHLDPAMFGAYGCTVNLADFRRAQAEFPALQKREPADVCVNWCVGGFDERILIDYRYPTEGADQFVIVFDNGEEFEKRISRIYDAVKEDESLLPANDWVAQVATILPLDAKHFPGLQAADVLAWNCNRHYSQGDHDDWFNAAWKNWQSEQVYYDYGRIVAEYSTGSWVLPTRAASR